jgi:hypothetical protein
MMRLIAKWRRSSVRLSYDASLGDTFGHRIERIYAASQSNSSEVLYELVAAFLVEPDPAVRKLLALSAMRVSKAVDVPIPPDELTMVHAAIEWKMPR